MAGIEVDGATEAIQLMPDMLDRPEEMVTDHHTNEKTLLEDPNAEKIDPLATTWLPSHLSS